MHESQQGINAPPGKVCGPIDLLAGATNTGSRDKVMRTASAAHVADLPGAVEHTGAGA